MPPARGLRAATEAKRPRNLLVQFEPQQPFVGEGLGRIAIMEGNGVVMLGKVVAREFGGVVDRTLPAAGFATTIQAQFALRVVGVLWNPIRRNTGGFATSQRHLRRPHSLTAGLESKNKNKIVSCPRLSG